MCGSADFVCIFAVYFVTLLIVYFMAVIRNTSSQRRVGRVGSDTFYVANGQQIVRQAQNNSNYGEGASRSEAQQKRRVRWANLVNLYKESKRWMPSAFETKKSNQSDYNKFMSVNMDNSEVCLTKDMAANGCAVIETVVVSQGSLSSIDLTDNSPYYSTNIRVPGLVINDSTKISDLAKAVINNNSSWKNKDGIAIIIFHGKRDRMGYPYTRTEYDEICLDVDNNEPLATNEDTVQFKVSESMLELSDVMYTDDEQYGIVLIHTRKEGKLLVSSQTLEVGDFSLMQEFSTRPWEQVCIQTYGVTEDVVLVPESEYAIINSWGIGQRENMQKWTSRFDELVASGDKVFLEIEHYSRSTCYAVVGSSHIDFTYEDGVYVLDTETTGRYSIMVNNVLVGQLTVN